MIYAPLIDLPESSGSEIVLNCRSAHDLSITPIFYTLEGETYTGADIVLKPAEIRFVDTKSLIPAKERKRHKWGGMAFTYFGGFMEAWAQLTLHGIRGGGSVNVLFTVLSQKRSNSAEAVWWTPRGGSAVVALGNSSDQQIHANLIFSTGASETVDVAPFGTEIVRPHSNTLGSASTDRVEGVSINYTGPEGSLIPTGYTASDAGKFASMIRFYDTQHFVQQELFANNLQVKRAEPHMVLRNVSGDFITASPTFLPASGDSSKSVKFDPVRLAPSETTEIDLSRLLKAAASSSDLDSVSVRVTNSGNPGSLVGALYSIDNRTRVTYDVPLRDSGPPRASTGGYPIRLDGDYTTVISINNTTDKPGDFTMQINYDSGPYVIGMIRLAPGATKIVDIRKIRDEQTPDINGHYLPRNLQIAQAKWSIRHNIRLNGRAEVVSLKDGVSSSYSCFSCCPNTFGGGTLYPMGNDCPSVTADDTVQFTAFEWDTNGYYCGGQQAPYQVYPSIWDSSDQSVATVDYNGLATGITGGYATISCYWDVTYWEWDDIDESCNETDAPFEGENCLLALDVQMSAAQSINDGGTASFNVTTSGTNGYVGVQSYAWSFTAPSGAGNSPNVTFTAADAASTNTDGHWFAKPDQPCAPASNPSAYWNAVYTIKCNVTFTNGKHKSKQTTLTVNSYWGDPGHVNPNEAGISGAPHQAVDQNGVWYVDGIGNLARVIPTKVVNIPTTSQFYAKTNAHEQAHVDHWALGAGNLYGDVFIPLDFYNRVKNFTAASQIELITKMAAELATYTNEQVAIIGPRHATDEQQAYAVSDQVAPAYVYQFCGSNQL